MSDMDILAIVDAERTPGEHDIGKEADLAIARIKSGAHWEDYETLGKELMIGRHACMKACQTKTPKGSVYNQMFSRWCKARGFSEIMDAGVRSNLLFCMEPQNYATMQTHRAQMKVKDRARLNHPSYMARKIKEWQKLGTAPAPERKPRVNPYDRIRELEAERAERQRASEDIQQAPMKREAKASRQTPAEEEAQMEARIREREGLSMTAQQKLDAAIRNEKRRLADSFDKILQAEVAAKVEEEIGFLLRQVKADRDQAHKDMAYARKGGFKFKAAVYKKILGALHPDSRNSISDARLAEAFQAFDDAERYLLAPPEPPSKHPPPPPLPETREELAEARKRVRERNSQRAREANAKRQKLKA